MPKKSILIGLVALLFLSSFFMIWVDYRKEPDLTGLDFLVRYRYLAAGFAVAALILAGLGEYAMISGVLVLFFLAELFYGSYISLRFLAPGFYISLGLTALLGFLCLTARDAQKRNLFKRLRKKTISPGQKAAE